jgi:hypothetical protein
MQVIRKGAPCDGFGLRWENVIVVGAWLAANNARVLQAVDRQLVLALFNAHGATRPALLTSWAGDNWGDSCLRLGRGKPNDWLS